MFDYDSENLIFNLIYDADRSFMPAKDLGEAIIGMSTCLRIAGRVSLLDFEDIYIFPIEVGSVKTPFGYITKKDGKAIIIGAAGGLASSLIFGSLSSIGQWGLAALKNPSGEILNKVDKKVLELCMNSDYRKSISKIAQPINEQNQKVTIKAGNKGYEITCENQYKFIHEDQEPILPELRNGETVTLKGQLTRMNMVPKNDLGFLYKGRTLSIFPNDPEKNVALEYHQFTPLPEVVVTGIVVRDTDYEVPKLKVIKMEAPKDLQQNLFEENTKNIALKQP